ncbi:hypothetical protein D3C85_1459940 [compost metagenome]
MPATSQIEVVDTGRIGRHQRGESEDQGAAQYHRATTVTIGGHPAQQHGSRHAKQIEGEGGVDLRLARPQAIGHLGDGDQIEIYSDRIENNHQKTAEQKGTHGDSVAGWNSRNDRTATARQR